MDHIPAQRKIPMTPAGLVDDCRFCKLVTDEVATAFFDEKLISTADYTVLASLGSLVAGWILVVPASHVLNLSTRYADPEFVAMRLSIAQILDDEFSSPVRIFEHGAKRFGSRTGCGVDHAHLHMLPFQSSLQDSIRTFEPELQWIETKSSNIERLTRDHEYLFYSDEAYSTDPVGLLAVVNEPISQFFRRVIAKELGQSDKYDYRLNYFEENILRTHTCMERGLNRGLQTLRRASI